MLGQSNGLQAVLGTSFYPNRLEVHLKAKPKIGCGSVGRAQRNFARPELQWGHLFAPTFDQQCLQAQIASTKKRSNRKAVPPTQQSKFWAIKTAKSHFRVRVRSEFMNDIGSQFATQVFTRPKYHPVGC